MRSDHGPETGPRTAGGVLFSVGHSNHELDQFIALLVGASVTAVADVRSAPYSRRQPQFNRPRLEGALQQRGIAYVFLGEQLGGRPADRDLYDEDGEGLRVNYERVRQTTAFRDGVDRLLRGLERYKVAMMCGEHDPLDCHRGLMIAPALLERGVAPLHLRRDGSVETTEELEKRLLAETKLAALLERPLFPPSDEEKREVLAEAYRVMARKRAFKQEAESEEF
jgi:uncharacterized protein (DUF488 family)